MPNRLANETSPYLLQHKDNPVDWQPWGPEAFAQAEAENKPIFLSVGYSSCHWCHVMEHESFEDPEVAKLLNERFVSIKVDREERPDVDEAYMTAVQLGSGRGGWPMSVFLTPDRKPFFAGTYFPKDDRPMTARDEKGQLRQMLQPGFLSVLKSISNQWTVAQAKLKDIGNQYADALRETREKPAPGTFRKWDHAFLEEAVRGLLAEFDPENGGFGGAPKFPPHTSLSLLMSYAARENAPMEVREAAVGAALFTLRQMCLGGLRDHVGGGFHRYATDAKWELPHFEKMLYDNALLLGNLLMAADIAQEMQPAWAQLYLEAAKGIIAWLHTEMRTPEGLFAAALDADSEGEEGKYYTWTEAELRELLGEGYEAFGKAYQVDPEGNFLDEATRERTGANHLRLLEEVGGSFGPELEVLRTARAKRERPGLDYKGLVGWNGLVIGALAEAGVIGSAEETARAILSAEQALGGLPHQVTSGKAIGDALLEDYAYVIDGFLRLAQARQFFSAHAEALPNLPVATHDWAAEARRLLDVAIASFYDSERGGFFATPVGHEDLFGRTKPAFDQPTPSANALLVDALLAFGDVERASQTIGYFLGLMERAPGATEALLLAAMPLLPEAVAGEEAPAIRPAGEVSVSFGPREARAESDGWGTFELRFEIPEGVHLNGNRPAARWLIPTTASVEPLEASIAWPSEEQYIGTVTIPVRLRLPEGSGGEEFQIDVRFQACTESECQEPVERRFGGVLVR